jgi:hypothetical protein
MDVVVGEQTFPMRMEFLTQLFVQNFCEQSRLKNSKNPEFFENEQNKSKLITIRLKENVNYEDIRPMLQDHERSFYRWFNVIVILYHLQTTQEKIIPILPLTKCFAQIIEMLIYLEESQLNESVDKIKAINKPKYPMATETFYVRKKL